MSNRINLARIATIFCGGCLVILKITFEDDYFFMIIIIFRHLELEIELAITASSKRKIIRNNFAP